jgi:hypothetical protein
MADRIAAHVIPTALRLEKNEVIVTATLALRPLVGANDDSNLAQWPKWIHQLFERRQVTAAMRKPGRTAIEARAIRSKLPDRYTKSGLGHNPVDWITTLWKELLQDTPGGSFAGLRLALAMPGKEAFGDTTRASTVTTSSGAASDQNELVPDVVGIPRNDLSHLFTVQRAKRIVETITAKGQGSKRASLYSGEGSWFDRPWARPATPLESLAMAVPAVVPWGTSAGFTPDGTPVLFASAVAPAAPRTYDPFRYEPGGDQSGGLHELREELVDQRTKLDEILDTKLADRRREADIVASASRDLQKGKAVKEGLATLKRARGEKRLGLKGAVDASKDQTALDERLAVHVAATRDDYGTYEPEPPPNAKECAAYRWFAVQGLPALQRLLHLAIDVEIAWDASSFRTAVGTSPDGTHFVEFGMRFATGPVIFTLTKVTLPSDDKGWGRCWPVTLEERLEVETAQPQRRDELRQRATIDQFDGIVDLEAATAGENGPIARFDIDSLDVIGAAESEVNRQRAVTHVNASIRSPGSDLSKTATDEALDSAAADRKLRTAGMRIVDQWRESVVIKEFTRAYDQVESAGDLDGMVLDADDLTIGFKLDVAVLDGEGGHRSWASLTDRRVSYALTPALSQVLKLPKGTSLDRIIDAFVGGHNAEQTSMLRRMLDGAALNMPTRLLQNKEKETAFSEPILATWEGDPLSLECREARAQNNKCDLPLQLTFDLDTTGAARPHRLRFGASYWFGARAVMMAGVSPTVDSARRYYESGLGPQGKGMALPASPKEVRRHLRFEWIDAPMVATPWSDIATEFGSRGGLDGNSMVVRSMPAAADGDAEPDEDRRRYGPNKTSRVLFAPAVDLTFAHLHGVFDDKAYAKLDAPPTGMRGIAYDRERGGFPSFVPGSPVAERSIVHASKDVTGQPMPSGLAVYRQAGAGSGGEGYFPDPAARHLIIAIRKGGPKGAYLRGEPIIVNLYPKDPRPNGPETPGYPNAVPIVVTVTAHTPGPVNEPLTYETLRKRTGRTDFARRIGLDLAASKSKSVEALEVELPLAPGEDVELEAWCVPDKAHLGAWFDAPESIAFLAAARPSGKEPAANEAVKAVRKLLGAPGANASGSQASFVIRRSESAVDVAAVREAAELLHKAMTSHPVPALAAVRRIRAVHAIEKPPAPAIKRDASAGWPIRLRRVREEEKKPLLQIADWKSWRRNDQSEGGTELLIGADVTLDPHTVETLELRLEAVAPRSRPIDDPQLGRTREDRMRGHWKEPAPCVPHPSDRLYGFRVYPDGRVDLKREQIVFARWRIDPVEVNGEATVDLLRLAHERLDKNREGNDRFFGDGTARRITAHVAATSRTAKLIPERSIYPAEAERKRDEQRQYAVKIVSDNSVIETVQTVLRATVRPSAVPPKSLLPAFLWTPSRRDPAGRIREFVRRTRIRIRLDRPWFTSGEEERLGIVLWPPNILQAKSTRESGESAIEWSELALAQGRVARAEPRGENDSHDLIDMIGQNKGAGPDDKFQAWRQPWFNDEDLGPGGVYVTRWGADPIHESGNVSWFLHAGAFTDVNDWRATAIDSIAVENEDTGVLWPEERRFEPRLVENVLMPIPEAERKPQDVNTKDDKPRDINFMLVSVLTYAPRFDVDMEQWYADVEIDPGVAPDPFLRLGLVRFQPHANRRLQLSQPVHEWVQITGFKRRVSLDFDQTSRVASVNVDVPRLASYEKEAPRTVLRASLIERRKTDSGTVVERVVRKPAPEGPMYEPYEFVSDAEPVATDTWIARFTLPPSLEGEEVYYAVLVEETYVMPRASFEDEPRPEVPDPDHGTRDPNLWQESGTRFAVRLEV